MSEKMNINDLGTTPQTFSQQGVSLKTLKEQNIILFKFFESKGFKEDAIIYSTDVENAFKSADINNNGKVSIREARSLFGAEDSKRKDVRTALRQLEAIKTNDLPQDAQILPVKINENETDFYNQNGVLLSNIRYEANQDKVETTYLDGQKDLIGKTIKTSADGKTVVTTEYLDGNPNFPEKINTNKDNNSVTVENKWQDENLVSQKTTEGDKVEIKKYKPGVKIPEETRLESKTDPYSKIITVNKFGDDNKVIGQTIEYSGRRIGENLVKEEIVLDSETGEKVSEEATFLDGTKQYYQYFDGKIHQVGKDKNGDSFVAFEVPEGWSMSKIASKFGITKEELLKANTTEDGRPTYRTNKKGVSYFLIDAKAVIPKPTKIPEDEGLILSYEMPAKKPLGKVEKQNADSNQEDQVEIPPLTQEKIELSILEAGLPEEQMVKVPPVELTEDAPVAQPVPSAPDKEVPPTAQKEDAPVEQPVPSVPDKPAKKPLGKVEKQNADSNQEDQVEIPPLTQEEIELSILEAGLPEEQMVKVPPVELTEDAPVAQPVPSAPNKEVPPTAQKEDAPDEQPVPSVPTAKVPPVELTEDAPVTQPVPSAPNKEVPPTAQTEEVPVKQPVPIKPVGKEKTEAKHVNKNKKQTPSEHVEKRKIPNNLSVSVRKKIAEAQNVAYQYLPSKASGIQKSLAGHDPMITLKKSRNMHMGFENEKLTEYNIKNTMCGIAKRGNSTLPSKLLRAYSNPSHKYANGFAYSYNYKTLIADLQFVKAKIEQAKKLGYKIPPALYAYIPPKSGDPKRIAIEVKAYEAVFGAGSAKQKI